MFARARPQYHSTMPSPFPGMDPYIEWDGYWSDFHHEMIGILRYRLLQSLPAAYDARINTMVRLVKHVDADPPSVAEDVMITRFPPGAGNGRAALPSASAAPTATMEPSARVSVPSPVYEEVKEAWIEIVTAQTDDVVTLIEVLSPTNKEGEGLRRFDRKRRATTRRGTNWVEIDLLLGGRRASYGSDRPPGDCFAHVIRGQQPSEADVFAWPISVPLPTIPVPLAEGDPDVPLDLAVAFTETYDRGQYRRRLRYDRDVTAEADSATLEWAKSVLAAAQSRDA